MQNAVSATLSPKQIFYTKTDQLQTIYNAKQSIIIVAMSIIPSAAVTVADFCCRTLASTTSYGMEEILRLTWGPLTSHNTSAGDCDEGGDSPNHF